MFNLSIDHQIKLLSYTTFKTHIMNGQSSSSGGSSYVWYWYWYCGHCSHTGAMREGLDEYCNNCHRRKDSYSTRDKIRVRVRR